MTSGAVTITQEPGGVVLALIGGEIDMANVASVEDAITEATASRAVGLIVDLSPLGYLDSAGVHMLLALASRCHRSSQSVRVVAPSGSRSRTVLKLAGADNLLALDETRAGAVDAIQAN